MLYQGCNIPGILGESLLHSCRVNGAQLKALQGARLPETEEEWQNVKATLDTLQPWLKDETTSDLFLQDLRGLITFIYGWWDARNKRESMYCLNTSSANNSGQNSEGLQDSGFLDVQISSHQGETAHAVHQPPFHSFFLKDAETANHTLRMMFNAVERHLHA